MKPTLLVFFWICLLPALVRAQTYNAVGLVFDEDKGEPLNGVRIYTKSGKLLNTSNSKGRFEVEVNSRQAILVFKRHTYQDLEVDLGEYAELIDMEISMESDVLELAPKDTVANRSLPRENFQAQSIDRLEQFSGMKIDLNDHLRQLEGVSGMSEFSSDISLYGGRTGDATHYLGQVRIPNLRHLDFGFPGNQSVLNPRLLKSVSVQDNLARGPMNQGNSSALVYELKEGNPEYITGEVVFGTINREINLTGYWEGRTFLLSGRLLEPTFLSSLGKKFFTEPKDARLGLSGKECDSLTKCQALPDAIDIESGDFFLGTFYRDSTGAFSRHSFLGLTDTFDVVQDIGESRSITKELYINQGSQAGIAYIYENLTPLTGGDLQYSMEASRRTRVDILRDTLPPPGDFNEKLPWYYSSGTEAEYLLGNTLQEEVRFFGSFLLSPNTRIFEAQYSYGLELEYFQDERKFLSGSNVQNKSAQEDFTAANAMLRLKWDLSGGKSLESAVGGHTAISGLFSEDTRETLLPMPVASFRYTQAFIPSLTGFAEIAMRQKSAVESREFNSLSTVTTSSAEAKTGINGNLGADLRYSGSVYTRLYKAPQLPVPDAYWNFREIQEADYAFVNGLNGILTWTPSHHFGMNLNASMIQGDYYLKDGGALPWEANRSLDLISNFKFMPRRDSLLSFIVTYGVNNDMPLYQYEIDNAAGTRKASQSGDFPVVSRQRTDVRLNLDLKSKWRPLENMRFFFEADNIFADMEGSFLDFLGGDNQRRRGWTRATSDGDMLPVVTRGMGFFIMFGFEGRLSI